MADRNLTGTNGDFVCPISSDTDERELLERIRAGQTDAFLALYDRYKGRVYAVCSDLLRNLEDAGDATAHVFQNAFEQIGRFRGEAAVSTWLLRIARNVSLNMIRKKKWERYWDRICPGRRDELTQKGEIGADEIAAGGATLEQTVILNEDARRVRDALDGLSEKMRAAITLWYWDGLEDSKIAEIFGCSPITIRTRRTKGLDRLRQALVGTE